MKDVCVFTNSLVFWSVVGWRPALLLAGLMLLASLSVGEALGAAPKAPLAYITQRDAQQDDSSDAQPLCSVPGAVSVIDTTTKEVVVTVFGVGPGPHGMVITSNGRKAYVANYGTFPSPLGQATCLSDTVAVLKLVSSRLEDDNGHENEDDNAVHFPKVVAMVKVGLGPLGVAITPDNAEVYVTNFGADLNPDSEDEGEGHTVSVIKTKSNEVVGPPIEVGRLPAGVAITPDGRRAYVTNRGSDTVSVINTKSKEVVATVKVQDKPANVAFTPNGRRAYVTNFGSNTVSVIDTATAETYPSQAMIATIPVGFVPIGLAVTPDGTRVYVVNVFSNNVSVIATATNSVVATVEVGSGPRAVAITPDGAHAYVTNFLSNTVSVIETATNEVVDTIPVVGGPNWVTITDRKAWKHDD